MKCINKHSLLFSAAIFSRLASLSAMLIIQMLVLVPSSYAGAFIAAGEANGIDVITHPSGYQGVGGTLTVGVCINPASVNTQDNTFQISDMEISVQNIVDTFNNQIITTGNLLLGGNNNIPGATDFDFESVALHEVGHCLGLAHVNAASESFSAPPNNAAEAALRNYTKATNGIDNSFNFAAGADGIIGSSDDMRGDDVNLHWFNNAFNDPFQIVSPVDSTTYSRVPGNLPNGGLFATNGDRNVAATIFSLLNTESIMQQGTAQDEAQRTLIADDVATLRYAMSGLDEIAGNADDYTLNLEYRGITTTNCNITITLKPDSGFAFCSPPVFFIGPSANQHIGITTATIVVSDAFNWFFNDIRNGAVDIIPDAFTLVDQTNVPLNLAIISDGITITGLTSSAAISVTNGEYSINGGAFTLTNGVVNNGNTVRVRHTSATTISTSTDTLLDIGGITDTFTSTTSAVVDTVPNAFSFTNVMGLETTNIVVSNTIVVSGITSAAAISVVGGEYRINFGSFTSVAGTVNNGDSVVLRHTSSINFSTSISTTLTIGGESATFTSTTKGSPGGGGSLHAVVVLILLALLLATSCRRILCHKNRNRV